MLAGAFPGSVVATILSSWFKVQTSGAKKRVFFYFASTTRGPSRFMVDPQEETYHRWPSIADRQPETFDAVTGDVVLSLLYTSTPDNRTTLPLTLEPTVLRLSARSRCRCPTRSPSAKAQPNASPLLRPQRPSRLPASGH